MEFGKLMKLDADRATIKGLYFCFDAPFMLQTTRTVDTLNNATLSSPVFSE